MSAVMRSMIIGILSFAVICNCVGYSHADETPPAPVEAAPAPAVVAPPPELDLRPLVAPLPPPSLMQAFADEHARLSRAHATRWAGVGIAGFGMITLVASLTLQINALVKGIYVDGYAETKAQADAAARPYQTAALGTAIAGGTLVLGGIAMVIVGQALSHHHSVGAITVAPSSNGLAVHF